MLKDIPLIRSFVNFELYLRLERAKGIRGMLIGRDIEELKSTLP